MNFSILSHITNQTPLEYPNKKRTHSDEEGSQSKLKVQTVFEEKVPAHFSLYRDLVLPAIFQKQVYLRPVLSYELDEAISIMDVLYDDEDWTAGMIEEAVKNNGFTKDKDCQSRFIVLTVQQKIVGAIYFGTNGSNIWTIADLAVKKEMKSKGYGSLLLLYAMIAVRELGCKNLQISTMTPEGSVLYTKFGFKPLDALDTIWNKLTEAEKTKINENSSRIHLKEEDIDQMIKIQLRKKLKE